LLVLVHVLLPLGMLGEVLGLSARPGSAWPLWLALLLGAQALRLWTMRTLGTYWTTRIWVVPGMTRIRSGPYRFVRHPNYVAVVVEVAAAPLLFGAWRTALGVSVLNLVALAIRIRAEERALGGEPPAGAPERV
jgi:methyltransferase